MADTTYQPGVWKKHGGNELHLNDNAYLYLGTDNDVVMYHDGTNLIGPAPATGLWAGCPGPTADPYIAYQVFEDFINCPLDDTTTVPDAWKISADTVATTFPASVVGGVIQITTGAVDNNEIYLQLGSINTVEPFIITDGSGKKLWFEARVKPLEHADVGYFVGLVEAGQAAGNFMADDSAVLADKDIVGFRTLTDASAEWDVAWKKNGQAVQEIANVVANGDDWHRFGFYFDGSHTVTFYIDGVASSTTAATTAATFPSGEELSPMIGCKTGNGTTKRFQVDYIKCVQLR